MGAKRGQDEVVQGLAWGTALRLSTSLRPGSLNLLALGMSPLLGLLLLALRLLTLHVCLGLRLRHLLLLQEEVLLRLLLVLLLLREKHAAETRQGRGLRLVGLLQKQPLLSLQRLDLLLECELCRG